MLRPTTLRSTADDLANRPTRVRDVAADLANNPSALRDFSAGFVNNPERWKAAAALVRSDEGRKLATMLSAHPGGREIAMFVANNLKAREIALALSINPVVFDVAFALIDNNFAGQLAASPGGRTVVAAVVDNLDDREIATNLVDSTIGKALAAQILDSPEAREVAISVTAAVRSSTLAEENSIRTVEELVGAVLLVAVSRVSLTAGALVAFSLFDGDDEAESSLPQLVSDLNAERTSEVRAALEGPTGLAFQFINDPDAEGLDQFTEAEIRFLLQQLELEYRKPKGSDSNQIRYYLAKIVDELIEIAHFGEHARQLLETLGGRPPAAVDAIVAELDEALAYLRDHWARTDQSDTIDLVAEPVEKIEAVGTEIDRITSPELLDRFKESIVEGTGKTIGGAIGVGLAGFATYMAQAYGIDAVTVVMHFLASIPELRWPFTTEERPETDDSS